MKKIIITIIFIFFANNANTENIQQKSIGDLLKENYEVIDKITPTPQDGNVYFILVKTITTAFRSEYIVCKVPLADFENKTMCKKP